jgi:hypothetical protein
MSHYPKGLYILNSLAAKAVADPKFKAKLKRSPAAELKRAGIDIPRGVKVIVHENTDKEIHLVLPSRTLEPADLDVESVDLIAVAFGTGF